MKTPKIEVGELIVLNRLKDATMYRIVETATHAIRLEYKTDEARLVGAGWIDKCYAMAPTQEQLEYTVRRVMYGEH